MQILQNYAGKNPYIKKLKKDFLKTGRMTLTENQIRYVTEFHNVEPLLINKIVSINNFLGEQMKENLKLSFTPAKILIEFMLADTEKSFHVFGKLTTKQEKSQMYWLPKTMVIDDPYFEDIEIEVDFEKYSELDKKKRIPYEHQKSGIKFLLGRKGCILADDMGLGKTYQSIIAALESGAQKILVVCPSSVKINWEREINDFCDDTAIVSGRKWNSAKFTIINYDILKNFHTLGDGKKKDDEPIIEFSREMVNSCFDLAIIDEAHNLKNNKSIRGEIMIDLCIKNNIERVWLLTGTPIANRPMDYFNLLKLIKAPVADNWKFFAQRYCDAKQITTTLRTGHRKQIWITTGASNLEELSLRTRNNMLVRKKHEVLDMPEKTIITNYQVLDKNGRTEYEGLWEEYLQKRREEKKKGTVEREMVELGLLRKFMAMEAIPYTVELAKDAIEQGQKVIIFTNFTDELMELADKFGKECVIHNGPMSSKHKQMSIDKFQENDKIKVFIGNIKSAGVGITLTAGSVVIFNSFDWVPGNNEQAEDRAYRIGQTNNVSVYYQLFKDTVTTTMWHTLKNKQNVINTIMGSIDFDDDKFLELLMDQMLNDDENEDL